MAASSCCPLCSDSSHSCANCSPIAPTQDRSSKTAPPQRMRSAWWVEDRFKRADHAKGFVVEPKRWIVASFRSRGSTAVVVLAKRLGLSSVPSVGRVAVAGWLKTGNTSTSMRSRSSALHPYA